MDKHFEKGLAPIVIILIVILGIAALGGVFYTLTKTNLLAPISNLQRPISKENKVTATLSSPTPTPKPTPIKLIPDNGTKGSYTVSSKGEGPGISRVIFDPFDVQKGQTLTITVTVGNQPLKPESVSGELELDNGKKTISFSKISVKGTSEIWEGKIKLEDTVLYKYILTITTKAGTKSSKAVVAPRS